MLKSCLFLFFCYVNVTLLILTKKKDFEGGREQKKNLGFYLFENFKIIFLLRIKENNHNVSRSLVELWNYFR